MGNTIDKRTVFHLRPIHYLDVNLKKPCRFFPYKTLQVDTLGYAAKKCSEMLKGYIAAISKQNRIKMAVTGGYDSRIIFLSSLHFECEYYVTKHPHMKDSHHDNYIPKQLTSQCDKDFPDRDG